MRWRTRTGGALALVGVLALAGAALTGCGVPTGGAQALPRSAVPSRLLEKQPPPTTTPTTFPSDYIEETLYWVSSNGTQLTSGTRDVPSDGALRALLDDLVSGPIASETASGDTTALPSNANLLGVSVGDGTVTVDFARPFGVISGNAQILAVAQVVYTVVDFAGCDDGVEFQINGTQVPVPVAGGALTTTPVHQLDYWQYAPTGWSCPS